MEASKFLFLIASSLSLHHHHDHGVQAFHVPLLRTRLCAAEAGGRRAQATTAATMRVSGIESTPNPSSFKFDLDQNIVESSEKGNGVRGITYTAGAAMGAPASIKRVLDLAGVESVYALGDWLCLNKAPSAKWDAIVPAAVDALGGAADSLDPLTLLMASGGDGGSAWKRSEMDGIAIRLQMSNGIPIQVEACPPGGTPLRRKLSPRFVDAMAEFVQSSGDEMAFFKGRQWLPRGVRYPEEIDEEDNGARTISAADSAEEALTAAAAEVELAFHESRLRGAVADAVISLQKSAAAAMSAPSAEDDHYGDGSESSESKGADNAAKGAVRAAAAALQSSERAEVIGAVDTLCEIAGRDATTRAAGEQGDRIAATASGDALDAIIGFAASGDGPVAARRAAVAFVGGAGDAVGATGLDAVAAVFRGDKNPGVRRTAGDALSDLGDARAIPVAVAGLHNKSKLVRWRAARVVGELAIREQDAVHLDEAREGELEFEVAFEMSDAARKVRSRAAAAGEETEGAAASAGPVWKQIQERNKAAS